MAIFLNNSPVKVVSNGTTFGSEPEPIIPREYQAVEWVCADANVGAYIDLGFAFDTGATIYLTQWLKDTVAYAYPFGAVENDGVLRCCISSPYNGAMNGTGLYSTLYGSKGNEFNGASVAFIPETKNEFCAILKNGKNFFENYTANSRQEYTSQVAYTMKSNLYLFAQNYNGAPRYGDRYEGIRKLGKFKYYDKNDILICDLVPCYRKSDGEIGMYDNVRRIFLTNVGTGKFTKGADVLY